jgi:hypothetical protein
VLALLCYAVAQALLDANDFIGLSAYGSGYPTDASQLTYRSAEIPLYTLAYELSFFGIDLKAYMDRPVLYVEQVRGTAAAGVAKIAPARFGLVNFGHSCCSSLWHVQRPKAPYVEQCGGVACDAALYEAWRMMTSSCCGLTRSHAYAAGAWWCAAVWCAAST